MYIVKKLEDYLGFSFDKKLESYLDEAQANKLEVNFADDPIVDIRTLENADLLHFDKTIPNFWVRKELGKKIIEVAMILKSMGLGLKLYELYRSLKKQTFEFNQISKEMKEKFPNLKPQELWEKTTEFIADPALRPPHVTGGAVDLVLVDKDGNELDMGTEINSIDQKSYLTCKDISLNALTNRALLLKLMLSVKLAPLPSEWWHFSYGENYWAAFYNKKVMYDVVEIS